MDESTRQRIIIALEEKTVSGSLACPISLDQTSWTIQANSTLLPVVDEPGQSVKPGAPAYPLAVVMCNHCGYTFLVNLIALGIMNEEGALVS